MLVLLEGKQHHVRAKTSLGTSAGHALTNGENLCLEKASTCPAMPWTLLWAEARDVCDTFPWLSLPSHPESSFPNHLHCPACLSPSLITALCRCLCVYTDYTSVPSLLELESVSDPMNTCPVCLAQPHTHHLPLSTHLLPHWAECAFPISEGNLMQRPPGLGALHLHQRVPCTALLTLSDVAQLSGPGAIASVLSPSSLWSFEINPKS